MDAKFLYYILGNRAIGCGAFDRKCSSKAQHEVLIYLKLIALRMPTEVIVVLQDKHARSLAGRLVEEARRRKAADTAPDNDQIVALA